MFPRGARFRGWDGGSSAATGARLRYAHSKGLFVGIALQGSVVLARPDCNESFYGSDESVEDILAGRVPRPVAAEPLYAALAEVRRPSGTRLVLAVATSVDPALWNIRAAQGPRLSPSTTAPPPF